MLACGDLPAARLWLEAHDRWLAWSGVVLGRPEGQAAWADYYRAAGDLGRARASAAAAVALARAPHLPLALLKALRLHGDLALDANDLVEAAHSLDEAHDLAIACAAPYERALTNMVAARFHAASGRPTEASVSLDEARQILDPLGARPALAQVETLVGWIQPVPTSLPLQPA